jgi:predicted glycosyltransferase
MSEHVFFYVQHLLGIGHLRRSEILAEAMAAAGLDVTVALGGRPIPEVPFRGIRTSQLPMAQIANEDFSTLLDAGGQPVGEDWKATRRAALLDLLRASEPDVLLIELYPFGRRQFAFELIPLLEAAHARDRRPRVACSVRDILVASKKPGRDAEVTGVVRRFFDAVLVHGDPALIPFEATFPSAKGLADLIHYTGYVAAPAPETTSVEGAGEVLVSTGSGAVGAPLLFSAIAARPITPLADKVWRLIAGPNLPATDLARLAAMADARTIVERFRDDFAARLKSSALSISQAGYNTTMDILRAGVPAVVVPYETASETEQRFRSDMLSAARLLTVLPAAELSPERLALAVAEALAKPRSSHHVDLNGAPTTARIIRELAARPPPAALQVR